MHCPFYNKNEGSYGKCEITNNKLDNKTSYNICKTGNLSIEKWKECAIYKRNSK